MKAYKMIGNQAVYDYRYMYGVYLHTDTMDVMLERCHLNSISRYAAANDRVSFEKLDGEEVVYDGDGFIITADGDTYRVYSDEEIPIIFERFAEVVRGIHNTRVAFRGF